MKSDDPAYIEITGVNELELTNYQIYGLRLPTAARLISDVMRNVKDLGAKGDGKTDDSKALQSILNLGGVIFFPKGTYIVNQPLFIKSNTQLISEGAVISKTFDVAKIEGVEHRYLLSQRVDPVSNVFIEGLTFDLKGNADIVKNENALGILFESPVYNLRVDNCIFKNASGCIAVDPKNNQSAEFIEVANCVAYAPNPLQPIFYFSSCKQPVVRNNWIERGKGQIYYVKCINGIIENNTCLNIDNYWGLGRHLGGIELYGDCDNITIVGNTLKSTATSNSGDIVGLRSKNNTNIYIKNNVFTWDNQTTSAIDIRNDAVSPVIPINHYVTGNVVHCEAPQALKLVNLVPDTAIRSVVIEGNNFENGSIVCFSSSAIPRVAYKDVVVRDNIFSGFSAWGLPESNYVVENNKIKRSTEESRAGISIRDARNSVVRYNVLMGDSFPMDRGIDYTNAVNSFIYSNTFINVNTPYFHLTGDDSNRVVTDFDRIY